MICRCCGKPLSTLDQILDATSTSYRGGPTICTPCIPKHWGKHAYGKNASRCHEFGNRRQPVINPLPAGIVEGDDR